MNNAAWAHGRRHNLSTWIRRRLREGRAHEVRVPGGRAIAEPPPTPHEHVCLPSRTWTARVVSNSWRRAESRRAASRQTPGPEEERVFGEQARCAGHIDVTSTDVSGGYLR